MEYGILIVTVAAVFGLCFLVDKGFTKCFRSKAQHRSGLAVRANKRYGLFGLLLSLLGVMGLVAGISGDWVMMIAGALVMILGLLLGGYYLSLGLFYDEDTFLYTQFAKADRTYHYRQIQGQRLYLVQGGNVVIELYMDDNTTVSLHSSMDGVYPFLDHAFAAWCRQTGRDPENCPFHDPSQSLWFPSVEEE